MSATLLAGINDAWTGNAALAFALTLYNDEPPEGTALPYAVVTRVREDVERANFEGGKDYRGHADVTVYGLGTATVEALVTQARTALEADGALVIDNRIVLDVMGDQYEVKIDPMRSTVARRVTEGTLYLFVWSHG